MYSYCALVLENFHSLHSWPWNDCWSRSKITRAEEQAVLLVSVKEDVSRTFRETSTRICCIAIDCNHPAPCYCLWELSLSGSQAWTSSGIFCGSISKAGISNNVIRQVWVMSFPSANFPSGWGLEICLFWTKLLTFDVKADPKGP